MITRRKVHRDIQPLFSVVVLRENEQGRTPSQLELGDCRWFCHLTVVLYTTNTDRCCTEVKYYLVAKPCHPADLPETLIELKLT
jgi:hypothetical protein